MQALCEAQRVARAMSENIKGRTRSQPSSVKAQECFGLDTEREWGRGTTAWGPVDARLGGPRISGCDPLCRNRPDLDAYDFGLTHGLMHGF